MLLLLLIALRHVLGGIRDLLLHLLCLLLVHAHLLELLLDLLLHLGILRELLKLIGDLLGGKGDMVEIKGLPGSPPARDRSEGMREAIAAFPGIHIVHDPVANWLREEAMTQMEIALAAHDHIDGIPKHVTPLDVTDKIDGRGFQQLMRLARELVTLAFFFANR